MERVKEKYYNTVVRLGQFGFPVRKKIPYLSIDILMAKKLLRKPTNWKGSKQSFYEFRASRLEPITGHLSSNGKSKNKAVQMLHNKVIKDSLCAQKS